MAKKCYLKSLKIKIKYEDEEGIANTCDQLGVLAWEQQDFKLAKKVVRGVPENLEKAW